MKADIKKALLGVGLSVMTAGCMLLAGCSVASKMESWVDKVFCEHEETKIVEAVAATCTEDGYTGDTICVACGAEVEEGTVVKATGHVYQWGECTACGEAENVENEQPEETAQVSGTWLFFETVYFDYGGIHPSALANVDFISNGVTYSKMTAVMGDGLYYGDTLVYDKDGWIDEAYRTVVFEDTQTVDSIFNFWFTDNAVSGTIIFTIDGMSYAALSDMTWGEWVESKCNTGGFYIDGELVRSASGETILDGTTHPVSQGTVIAAYAYVIGSHGGGSN